MDKNISLRKLKVEIKSHGMSIAEFAEKCGVAPASMSGLCCGVRIPKTDMVAKMCSVLGVYPSKIVSFDGIDVNAKYFTDDKKEPLPESPEGELTYKPLWLFLSDYLARKEGKSANDLFDQIEPPRRLAGYKVTEGLSEKGFAARYGEGYKSERTQRTDYSKGLPAVTRVKLRNDRPLTMGVIYEICRKLGCTIDFVLGYK